jgi:membrane protease YdiL (CAAX protease family)
MGTLQRERVKLLIMAGLLLPALMILAGTGLAYLHDRVWPDLIHLPTPGAIGWGVVTGLATLGLVQLLSKSSTWFEQALRQSSGKTSQEALRTAGYGVLVVMVVMNAVGEEVLFRGGLQPWIGLLPAALLFGFSHGGWRRQMVSYAVVAAFSGTLFGIAYWVSGTLWVPVVAHALHNLISVYFIDKRIDVHWDGLWPRVRFLVEEDAQTLVAEVQEPPGEAGDSATERED